MAKEKILIVEDQYTEAASLKRTLESAGYCICGIARTGEKAFQLLEQDIPDFVLLDIVLPGQVTGIEIGSRLRQKNIPFIYISGNSDASTLQAAKITRPFGFIVKPFRQKDVLASLEIGRYWHQYSIENLIAGEKGMVAGHGPASQASVAIRSPRLIGQSPAFRELLQHVEQVAPFDISVLLMGESGTGKEKVAELIHELSHRRKHPLIKVNCAAMPATLIESILFGHEKGAFTGADERRIGKFEQAEGGTIFLDEIGEMSPDLQIKLLRVLQEREIERIGSPETHPINVRVIAATNRDLDKEVAEYRFRLDLYYRLSAFPLTIPALRHRKEDIPPLANHFIQKHAAKMHLPQVPIGAMAMATLMEHDWPGNIRELEHVLERALVLSGQKPIQQIFIQSGINRSPSGAGGPSAAGAGVPSGNGKIKTMEEHDKEHIISVLRMAKGRIFGEDGAAKVLGLKSPTLYARIRKMGIDIKKLLS
jgi:two-component system, NtrC family, response regulator HydG